MRTKYLESVLRIATEGTKNHAELHLDSGALLAIFPSTNTPRLPPHEVWSTRRVGAAMTVPPLRVTDETLSTAIGSVVKINNYPLALSFWIDTAALSQTWLAEFFTYGAVALASGLALSGVAFIALRMAKREKRALAGWKGELGQRLEAELAASRMKKYEALGAMAGGIAHYFNNLLPALRGHLEIASLEARSGRADKERLSRMTDAVDDARDFLRGILTYSGRNVAKFDRVDLSQTIGRTLEILAPLFRTNIILTSSIEPDIFIYGDVSQTANFVANILKNAIESLGAGGGKILVRLRARISASGDCEARFECRDTGCGMSEGTIERALDPFFTTKPESGTGLGLAICDGIVRSHGGKIHMESKVGQGTRVTITLPLIDRV